MTQGDGELAIAKVREALDAAGASDIEIKVVEGSIHTVEDAAATVGVPPEEILKSLVLVVDGTTPCLALMSGANRTDAKAVARALGGRRARMMPPDEVSARYGFRVGGVPPVGYPERLPAALDEDLFAYGTVWAAAGTEHAFFPVSPGRLLELTGGTRARIRKEAPPPVEEGGS